MHILIFLINSLHNLILSKATLLKQLKQHPIMQLSSPLINQMQESWITQSQQTLILIERIISDLIKSI